jgi:hypothetical protein
MRILGIFAAFMMFSNLVLADNWGLEKTLLLGTDGITKNFRCSSKGLDADNANQSFFENIVSNEECRVDFGMDRQCALQLIGGLYEPLHYQLIHIPIIKQFDIVSEKMVQRGGCSDRQYMALDFGALQMPMPNSDTHIAAVENVNVDTVRGLVQFDVTLVNSKLNQTSHYRVTFQAESEESVSCPTGFKVCKDKCCVQ